MRGSQHTGDMFQANTMNKVEKEAGGIKAVRAAST